MRLRFTKRNIGLGLGLAVAVLLIGSVATGAGRSAIDYSLYTVATVQQKWYLLHAMPGIIKEDRANASRADFDLYMPDYRQFGFTPERITAGLSTKDQQPYVHMIFSGKPLGMDVNEFRMTSYYDPPNNCGSGVLDIPSDNPTPCRLYMTTPKGVVVYESRYDLPDTSHDFYIRLGNTLISMSESFGYDASTGRRDQTASQRQLGAFIDGLRVTKPADIPFQHHDL